MPKILDFWSKKLTVVFVETMLQKRDILPTSRIFGKNTEGYYTKYYFKNETSNKEYCFIHYIPKALVSFTFNSQKNTHVIIEHATTRKKFIDILDRLKTEIS